MATTTQVTSDLALSWDVHDVWTQAYVGVRHLIYELLPQPGRRMSIESHALCQLGLIGANHLMEVGLFRYLQSRATFASLSNAEKALVRKAHYSDMLTKWVPKIAGWNPDLTAAPFKCTERLRQRRNQTIHNESARANVPMCRSAIFSSVTATSELWRATGEAFPYEQFLRKYTLQDERPFSEVTYPK